MQDEFVKINITIDEALDNDSYCSINCNKTSLDRIIKWSTSKYNGYKKPEVIKDIMKRVKINDNIFWEYRCGSYGEGNHNRGISYYLMCRVDGDYLVCAFDTQYKIYKFKGGK